MRLRISDTGIHTYIHTNLYSAKIVERIWGASEWVSSFLTAHQHIIGHSVPFMHLAHYKLVYYYYIHAVPKYVAIWMSWNIDIPWSLNCSDTFPRTKFENRALTSCRPGPILSTTSTISFQLHAKVAEEIDLETCSYGQLSEVQMVRDLDLGSSQGHGNIHSTCRTTSVPNHMTLA